MEQQSQQPHSSTAGRDSSGKVSVLLGAAPRLTVIGSTGSKQLTFLYPCSVQLRLHFGRTDGVNAVLPGDEATFPPLDGSSDADQQQQEQSQAPAAADMAVAEKSAAGVAAAVDAEPSSIVSLLAPSSPAASLAAVPAEAASEEAMPQPVTPAAAAAAADAAVSLVAAAETTVSSPNDAAVAVVQQNPVKGPVASPESIVADGWTRAAQPAAAGSPRHPDSAPPKLGMLMGDYETPRPRNVCSAELRPGSSMKRTWFSFSSKNKAHRCAVDACA